MGILGCAEGHHISDFNDLERHKDDPHVKPINDLVLELKTRQDRFVPFVSPRYGGINARLLAVHRSPGVKTRPAGEGGTGFLDVENPDQAARRHADFLSRAGIELGDIMSWNAFPWAEPDLDDEGQWDQGADALAKIIRMLDNLSVVMLHGNESHRMWEVLWSRNRAIAEGFKPIATRSLGFALVNPHTKSPAQIATTNREITEAFQTAARSLQYAPTVGTRHLVDNAELAAKRHLINQAARPTTTSKPSDLRPANTAEWDAQWGREWPLPPDER